MKTEVIPFGKYKGQPVSQLRHDPEYVEWLMSQDWFLKRYRDINTLIINNFKEPNETPEHNRLQMMFLDDEFVSLVVSDKSPFMREQWDRWKGIKSKWDTIVREQESSVLWSGKEDSYKASVRFESGDGWDVVIYQRFDYHWNKAESLTGRWFGTRQDYRGETCDFNLYGELKPAIGEEFPRILRECKSRGAPNGKRFVLYESYTGTGATEQQVKKMFERENIRMARIDELRKGDT